MRRGRGSCLAAALFAGCAAQAPLDPSVVPVEASTAREPGPLPAPLADAGGFDALLPVTGPDDLRAGDRVLYRVRHHVDGEQETLLLAVRLGEPDGSLRTEPARLAWQDEELRYPLASPNRRCEINVYDVTRGRESVAALLVPEVSMLENLYSAAVVHDALGADAAPSDEDLRRLALGIDSTVTLFRLWQENDVLRDLLERVVGRPSVLALLRAAVTFDFSYTISIDLSAKERAPAELPPPFGPLDGYRVPMSISAAGQTLLRMDACFVGCASPLSVGLGLVSFRGIHPTDPERWIAVDLIGARRGSQ